MRGLVLLGLAAMLAFAGLVIFLRWKGAPPPVVKMDARSMAVLLFQVQPTTGFPAALGPVIAVADEFPSTPGRDIRYQAVLTLADRGSAKVPWDVYRELLDVHRQFCNFRKHTGAGSEYIDEANARRIILRGLVDLATWHARQDRTKVTPGPQLLAVYRAVDTLAQSSIPELASEARKTQATLFR